MSLLIFSPQCSHSLDIIDYINKHEQLKQIVQYHNINKLGIPPQYKNKITRVPTMLTKNGKLLVGNEIRNWLESLLPVQELEMCGFGGCSMTTLEGEGLGDIFGLDDYGRSLQPPMTKELEERINQSVSDAYNKNIKK
jgi:hypothetical protein